MANSGKMARCRRRQESSGPPPIEGRGYTTKDRSVSIIPFAQEPSPSGPPIPMRTGSTDQTGRPPRNAATGEPTPPTDSCQQHGNLRQDAQQHMERCHNDQRLRRRLNAQAPTYERTSPAAGSRQVGTLFRPQQYGSAPASEGVLKLRRAAMNPLVNRCPPNGNTKPGQRTCLWVFFVLCRWSAAVFHLAPQDANYQYQKVIIC